MIGRARRRNDAGLPTATRPRAGRRGLVLLYVGILVAAVFFFAAQRYSPPAKPVPTLPTLATTPVVLGDPRTTTVQAHVGEFLAVQLPTGADLRFETTLSHPAIAEPVVDVVSAETEPPLLRVLRTGTVLVTVLLKPACVADPACLDYQRDAGSVRIVVPG